MSADAVTYPVCAHDHCHGVPPYYASYVALYFIVARVRRLVLEGNGVYVGGVCGVWKLYALLLGVYPEFPKQVARPLAAGILDHVFKRFDPFPVFGFFFRYSRIFFHYPYKMRRSEAAGEPAAWSNHIVLAIENPISSAKNGALDPKRKPEFGKAF